MYPCLYILARYRAILRSHLAEVEGANEELEEVRGMARTLDLFLKLKVFFTKI